MRPRIVLAALLTGVALLGAAIGVAAWEAADDDSDRVATTVAARDSAQTAAQSSTALGEVYDRASPGVVEIVAQGAREGFGPFAPGETIATGSGFVIDEEGRILTNQHVVGEADSVTVRFPDGDEAQARVVGSDPSTDIALLDLVEDRDVTPLELGSADSLDVGDPVAAIGSPFGLEGTLTAGIVSAVDRDIQAPNGFVIDGAIQTDAAINSGSSGGPLFDSEGRVVGVTSQIESRSGGNVGIGYAVPIETAQRVVDQLLEDGEVEHAYLGVRLDDESPDDGVRIAEAADGGPAQDAGLRAGDVILSVGGDEVGTPDEVRAAIDVRSPGDTIELRIRRDGESRTVEVELGQRPVASE
jgi:putative serine protease PepD